MTDMTNKISDLVSARLDALLVMPEFATGVPTDEDKAEYRQKLEQQLSIKATSTKELETRAMICGELIRRTQMTSTSRGLIIKPVSEADAAEILMALMHLKRVGEIFDDNTPLMVYDFEEGTYGERNVDLFRLMNIIEPLMKEMGRKETRSRIIQNCGFAYPTKDEDLAVLGNGIFNINTKELKPFTPELVFLSKASVDWNPDAVCPTFPDGWTFDGFLNEQFDNDNESRILIYQILQAALLTNKPKDVFIYFYSLQGRTGKGTLTDLIRHLVGLQNSGSANIEQLEQPFGLENVYNKAFICGNENDNVFAKSSVNIKNLASGDLVTVNRKTIVNISVCATPLIIQSMNSTPVFRGLDGGTKNRMRVIEFTHSYYEDDNENVKKVYIKNKEFLEYLAHKVLMMPVDVMIDPAKSREIKNEIEMESNPVLEWFVEEFDNFVGDEFATSVLFDAFRYWIRKQNKKDNMSRMTFSKRLKMLSKNVLEFIPKNMLPNMSEVDLEVIRANLVASQLILPNAKMETYYQLKTKRQSGFKRIVK